MNEPGPLLETLTRRLSECPADFLLRPRPIHRDGIDVAAIVCDLLRDWQAAPQVSQAVATFAQAGVKLKENRWQLMAVTVWLLNDEWFLERRALAPAAWELLWRGLDAIARVVPAATAVTDPDRREELARLCLARLGLRPQGETRAQAQDRLTTLDSVERDRVVRQTRQVEARARQIREAAARRAAEEAAVRYSPE